MAAEMVGDLEPVRAIVDEPEVRPVQAEEAPSMGGRHKEWKGRQHAGDGMRRGVLGEEVGGERAEIGLKAEDRGKPAVREAQRRREEERHVGREPPQAVQCEKGRRDSHKGAAKQRALVRRGLRPSFPRRVVVRIVVPKVVPRRDVTVPHLVRKIAKVVPGALPSIVIVVG